MKIKEGFVAREFAGKIVAVPIDDTSDSRNVIVTLSKTGAFVWNILQKGAEYDEILKEILNTYDVDESQAKADLDEFLKIAKGADLIDE